MRQDQVRGCRRTGGTRVPVTIRSYHVYFPYESTRASSWARASFLAGDSHQPPSSPQATQGLRSPELTTEPVSVCAFSCRCRRERICSALVCVPLLPLLPQGWGDQARTSSPAGTGRWGIGRGRGASLTRLVEAHLPERIPSHAQGAWLLPGGRGSHGQTEGRLGREEADPGIATRYSPRGLGPRA